MGDPAIITAAVQGKAFPATTSKNVYWEKALFHSRYKFSGISFPSLCILQAQYVCEMCEYYDAIYKRVAQGSEPCPMKMDHKTTFWKLKSSFYGIIEHYMQI